MLFYVKTKPNSFVCEFWGCFSVWICRSPEGLGSLLVLSEWYVTPTTMALCPPPFALSQGGGGGQVCIPHLFVCQEKAAQSTVLAHTGITGMALTALSIFVREAER